MFQIQLEGMKEKREKLEITKNLVESWQAKKLFEEVYSKMFIRKFELGDCSS